MECKNKSSECCKLDIGRGCNFCNCGEETQSTVCEGCFKLHVTDWLEGMPEMSPDDVFEVRFKNTRRSYFRNVNNLPLKMGDIVAVESSPGHDIGIVSLTGDMVGRQMRRVGFSPQNGEFKKIYRKAKPYDIEKWQEAIALEHETMIRSRQIAADMGLNMKIGDVEYQGDKLKAIFYYIADERVDFRELIKVFAEQFRIRVEMKQIGARQEAGRIGGLGSCGRELCCASWIASFSSVTTNAARTQEISLNPQKLAGQCSKLKCCLVYELDDYLDARKEFPRVNQPLQALDGEYYLVKTDILGRKMSFSTSPTAIVGMVTLPLSRVKEVLEANRRGVKVDKLEGEAPLAAKVQEPVFVNVIGEESITRFDKEGGDKRGRGRNRRGRQDRPAGSSPEGGSAPQDAGSRESRPNNEGAKQNDNNQGRNQQNNRGGRGGDRRQGPQGNQGGQGGQRRQNDNGGQNERRDNGGQQQGGNGGRNANERRAQGANGSEQRTDRQPNLNKNSQGEGNQSSSEGQRERNGARNSRGRGRNRRPVGKPGSSNEGNNSNE